jgi:hypothetical protein
VKAQKDAGVAALHKRIVQVGLVAPARSCRLVVLFGGGAPHLRCLCPIPTQ